MLVVALHPKPSLVGAKAYFQHPMTVTLGRSFGEFEQEVAEQPSQGTAVRWNRRQMHALDHPHISEPHVRLHFHQDNVLLVDLNSKNGTLVNGAPTLPTEPTSIEVGSVLTLGPVVLLLARSRRVAPEPHDPLLLGRSAAIDDLLQRLHEVGDGPVLIRGEMGTGKEHVANVLIRDSKKEPSRKLNCAVLRSELSELFGYKKGMFTGADCDKKGILEELDGGILYLDEVADLDLKTQAQLLRFLQSGDVQQLGASSPRKVTVRVISASNADFERKIAEHTFRDDLYYRLAKVQVVVPTLAQRKEDLPILFYHFLGQNNALGWPISRSLMVELLLHDWPGNVRELESAVAHLVAAAKYAHERHPERPLLLRMTDALRERIPQTTRAKERNVVSLAPPALPLVPEQAGTVTERGAITRPSAAGLVAGLREHGTMRAFAAHLKIGRSTLYRWFKEDGIDPDAVVSGRERWGGRRS